MRTLLRVCVFDYRLQRVWVWVWARVCECRLYVFPLVHLIANNNKIRSQSSWTQA